MSTSIYQDNPHTLFNMPLSSRTKSMMKCRIVRWRMRKVRIKKRKPSVRTSIKHLPSGILVDNILNRLPSTSLCSLKSVSKSFNNSTTIALFNENRHKTCNWIILRISIPSTIGPYNNNQLYFLDNGGHLNKLIQPRIEKKYKVGPILSCNCLLCVLYYKNKRGCSLDHYRACLFNPLTGEHNFLLDPGLPRVAGESSHLPRVLAGESSSHNGNMVGPEQIFGFGFDARTHEYKLVRIVRFSPEDVRTHLQVEVFTLGKNECRVYEIDASFVCPRQSSDVVVGGAIHWLCEDENSTRCCKSKTILSFDLFEEKFHQIPKPRCDVCEFCHLSVLGGCLAITGGYRETCRTHEVHIWLLKEYGVKESWTRKFVIEQGFSRLYPLFLLNNGKIVMSCESKVLCYDPEEEYFETYPDRDCFNETAELDYSIVAICHTCGLVSPFGL